MKSEIYTHIHTHTLHLLCWKIAYRIFDLTDKYILNKYILNILKDIKL